jgi:hypothetical protein
MLISMGPLHSPRLSRLPPMFWILLLSALAHPAWSVADAIVHGHQAEHHAEADAGRLATAPQLAPDHGHHDHGHLDGALGVPSRGGELNGGAALPCSAIAGSDTASRFGGPHPERAPACRGAVLSGTPGPRAPPRA